MTITMHSFGASITVGSTRPPFVTDWARRAERGGGCIWKSRVMFIRKIGEPRNPRGGGGGHPNPPDHPPEVAFFALPHRASPSPTKPRKILILCPISPNFFVAGGCCRYVSGTIPETGD